MALDVKELCRLCGKKAEFSKDLKNEDNKNILKMIQEFIQIPFAEHSELPTKVCLNCEEKIQSFQLFVLECYNVQETLRQMCLETGEKYPIKLEDDIVVDFNISAIRSEVKHELSAEDLVNSINSDKCMTGFDADDYNNGNDDDDNETLATLKRKKVTSTEMGKKHLEEISDLDTGDLVKFSARGAGAAHRPAAHDKVRCYVCGVCGQACGSASDLYRHRAVHSDDRPFECHECRKRFKTSSNLKMHEEAHDDTWYVCPLCGKLFKRQQTLKIHLRTCLKSSKET